ncbi:MAG: efflux RND transporter permease subunit [Candidatus Cloacimonetes bacterium]|nr:efflux RND transporter permease subunit [Candidatus Cloacimonadota bacterium]
MFLSDLSIKRPILITMIIMVFIVFGLLGYFALNLNMMPDVSIPFVTIQTIYPGAGPKEIETQITKIIEDEVATISNINYIQSYSMESVSLVLMRFDMNKDVNIAAQDVKDKIAAIQNQLPADADVPVTAKFEMGSEPVVSMVLSGDVTPAELYHIADTQLRDRLSQIQGVAQVNLTGGQEREIRVEFDDRIVTQNMISLPQMSQILAMNNLDMPGGQFDRAGREYAVRLEGEFDAVTQIRNLEIQTPFGIKKLGQIASVIDTTATVRKRSTYFNNVEKTGSDNVVKATIIKSQDGNAVEISDLLTKELPGIRASLPHGVQLNIIDDTSVFVRASVDDTLSNILLGILFTGLILLLFLHDLRATLIAALAMPMSIISTFLFMQLLGFTLNIFTLMGLSISVGILVTNSVVVLENIFRHKRSGQDKKEAAAKGTSEITIAVLASTLTNIVVFLPIAAMTSMVGQMFKEFALTVTFATIFSLIASFTLTPMLAGLILPKELKLNKFGAWFNKGFVKIEKFYGRMLVVLFKKKRYAFFVILIALILFIGSLQLAGKVGFEFVPLLDEGNISIEIELPQGASLESTAKSVKEIETIVAKHDEVMFITSTIGEANEMSRGTNLAKMNVKLVDADERIAKTTDINNLLIKELSEVSGAKIKPNVQSSASGGESPIEFYLKGQDIEVLEELKQQILDNCRDIYGLVNFDASTRSGKPELSIVPDRNKLAQSGVSIQELAFTLRASVEGLVTTTFRDGGKEYDIRIVLNKDSVDSPDKIRNLPVVTRHGVFPMSQLAEVSYSHGINSIQHRDKFTAIGFTGSPAVGVPLGDVTSGIDKRIAEMDMPPGYEVQWSGSAEFMQEMMIDMLRTFILAILLTYMLLAAILESFTQPFLILLTLPLALIGVFGALYVANVTMSIFSMMAIIMLVGIVVNNAILLLDYTNQLVREGYPVRKALATACPIKLRPIIMSNLAIVIGMMPMAIGIGSAGREFRQAMGVVSIGGVIVSTFLSLLIIPSLYLITHKLQKIKK